MPEMNSADETPESHIGYNTGLTGANVDTAQAVNDRGERDRALLDRDAARAAEAAVGVKLEAALAELGELQRKYKQLTSERDADVNRQHEIAKDLRVRLDWAEQALAGLPPGTLSQPQALDQVAPSSVQRADAEQEHRDRDKAAQADQDSALRAEEAAQALKADQERQDFEEAQAAEASALVVDETEAKPAKKKKSVW